MKKPKKQDNRDKLKSYQHAARLVCYYCREKYFLIDDEDIRLEIWKDAKGQKHRLGTWVHDVEDDEVEHCRAGRIWDYLVKSGLMKRPQRR